MNINLSKFIINSPLEQFEVTSLLGFNAPIFGYLNITLTNLALYSVLVISIIVAIHYLGNNDNRLVPSKWSISLESIYASINSMVREQLGKEVYYPFIYSLFFFILIANLCGNVPYSFTITTSIMVSIGLSFTILIAVTILGLSIHRLKFFSYFVPSGTPLALVPLEPPKPKRTGSVLGSMSVVKRGTRMLSLMRLGFFLNQLMSHFSLCVGGC